MWPIRTSMPRSSSSGRPAPRSRRSPASCYRDQPQRDALAQRREFEPREHVGGGEDRRQPDRAALPVGRGLFAGSRSQGTGGATPHRDRSVPARRARRGDPGLGSPDDRPGPDYRLQRAGRGVPGRARGRQRGGAGWSAHHARRARRRAGAVRGRVNLVRAQRDEIVSAYWLKQSIGELGAAALGLPVALYDATGHYDAVRDKWFGLGSGG